MTRASERMAIGQSRALTAGETALAMGMFGQGIAYPKVRIVQIPRLHFGAMVPWGRIIVFADWRAPQDFTAAPLAEQGWFIHEMAHVWQAARGIVLPLAKLRALGRGAYRVRLHPGQPLAAYNIEAQAEIARLVWLARMGATAPDARLAALWARGIERKTILAA